MKTQPIQVPSALITQAYQADTLARKTSPVARTSEKASALRKTHKGLARPPFECIALLLQGGGALGAYQAGVYEALSEAGLHPDWVAGISIGAINSALIAGNPPEARANKLRQFWEGITDPLTVQIETFGRLWEAIAASALSIGPSIVSVGAPLGELTRGLMNQMSAGLAVLRGATGFFVPRLPSPWLQPAGTLGATSYYDTAQLKTTLERLVDFDLINAGAMRFSVGAVNVGTGNLIYFDNATDTIRPEHVMASGGLPPGFPAIEIAGEHYWDGGLVSNTPLQWALENGPHQDTLAFQVDLWSARGTFPRNVAEVTTRQKEIQYSSRTRANTDRFKHIQQLRNALSMLLEKLPPELRDSPEAGALYPEAWRKVYNLVQLIYRSQKYEGDSKDYEFSRLSMEEHWRAGHDDTVRTLRHPEVLERPRNREGVFTFDLAYDGRE